MKKFILTLGSVASIMVPLATTIACGTSSTIADDADEPEVITNLDLKDFFAPQPSYPTTVEEIEVALKEITEWTNEYAYNLAYGDNILTVTYEGVFTRFEGENLVIGRVSGVVKVEDIATYKGIVATDLSDIIDHYKSEWVADENVDFQLSPRGQLFHDIALGKTAVDAKTT